MPIFNESPDTALLTKEEKTWIRKLEKLLLSTPKRFGVFTIGDPTLHIYDKYEMQERGIEEEECNDSDVNLNLAMIDSSTHINGWCG